MAGMVMAFMEGMGILVEGQLGLLKGTMEAAMGMMERVTNNMMEREVGLERMSVNTYSLLGTLHLGQEGST